VLLRLQLVECNCMLGVPSAYLGPVDTKAFISDLEFTSGISK
jgi:hypothetical protein